MKTIRYRGKKIAFIDRGEGPCLVLLHGFTESSGIWKQFIRHLSSRFRVVAVDMPGFGKSDSLAEVHSMELMAGMVKNVLQELGIRQCVMTGHSMGGYVTLAFARLYPRMLKGICIFHSHPYADTPEGLQNRERAIEVIRGDKFNFIMQFIPTLFPDGSHEKYRKQIDNLIREASGLTREAILAAMIGMKEREDSVEILKKLKVPVLFILGMKDIKIPMERAGEMILLPKHSESLILQDVAHMGFYEAPRITLRTLRDFVARCWKTGSRIQDPGSSI
ncbi:MAG: alpha/beta hydrolase [Bacteroidia bacterium]|nr:alpha/beta hydrolase [Bacteroidia bacterium]